MFSEDNKTYAFASGNGCVIQDDEIIKYFKNKKDFLEHILINCSFENCKYMIENEVPISKNWNYIIASHPDFKQKRDYLKHRTIFWMKTIDDAHYALENNIPFKNLSGLPEPESYILENYKEEIKESLKDLNVTKAVLFIGETPKTLLFNDIYIDELGLYYREDKLIRNIDARTECFMYGTIEDCRKFKKFSSENYRDIYDKDIFEKYDLLQENNIPLPHSIFIRPSNEKLWLEKLKGLDVRLLGSTKAIRDKYPDLGKSKMQFKGVIQCILSGETEIHTDKTLGKICIKFGYTDIGDGYYQKNNIKGV